MPKKRNPGIRNLAVAGVFSAMITLFIFFPKIPIPATNGYVHLGDSLIYVAASVLPMPYAIAAAAVGGALADLWAGAVPYIAATAVIKAVMAFFASLFIKNAKPARMALGFLIGAFITVAGYFVFEWLSFGLAYASAGVLWNAAQGVLGALLTVPMLAALKSRAISRLFK